MPEPPRPKRFQIHLSTAIVMMFAAGALMWANVRPHRQDAKHALHNPDDLARFQNAVHKTALGIQKFNYGRAVPLKPFEEYKVETYGWPSPVVTTVLVRVFFGDVTPTGIDQHASMVVDSFKITSYKNAGVDTAFALGLFFAVWFLCERLIRRRTARKEP